MLFDVLLTVVAGVLSVRIAFSFLHSLGATSCETLFDSSCAVVAGSFGLFIGLLMIVAPDKPVPFFLEAAVPVSFIASPILMGLFVATILLSRWFVQHFVDLFDSASH